jgi:hypothetical protein
VCGALFHVAGIHQRFDVDVEVGGHVRVESTEYEELLGELIELVEAPLSGLDTQSPLAVLEQR